MKDTPLQLTLRELQVMCSSFRFWIGLAAVVIILAIAGPFGTLTELGFAERLVYWAFSASITFFCGLAVSYLTGLFLFQSGMPEWPARIVGGIVAGLPVAILVWTINKYGFLMDMGGGSCIPQGLDLLHNNIRIHHDTLYIAKRHRPGKSRSFTLFCKGCQDTWEASCYIFQHKIIMLRR